MLISITGTPGTGKTTVSEGLRGDGHEVIDLNEHIKARGLLGGFDDERDTHEVDVKALGRSLAHLRGSEDRIFLDGHLSHFLDCDVILVLRCNPSVLNERLIRRGYSEGKVLENVQAEALDVILCESLDSGVPVYEVDCTSSDTNTIISAIGHILAGDTEGYMPGSVNWGEEMVKWF